MRLFTSLRIIRVTLAFAVALWMAGAGCLLGCENNVASAATEVDHHAKPSGLVVNGGTCAAHGKSAKHESKPKQGPKQASPQSAAKPKVTKQSVTTAHTFALEGSSSSMMNCPLAVNAAAALSKSGPDNTPSDLPLTSASQPLADSLEQIAALARPPRLPNRGHTYLRCCVFLI